MGPSWTTRGCGRTASPSGRCSADWPSAATRSGRCWTPARCSRRSISPSSMEPLAVLGARGVLPLLRGPALGLAGGGGLPLVEQAVAERVLAFQVGAHAEFADGVARDDRVLVGAQHGLDLLHPPGEPP